MSDTILTLSNTLNGKSFFKQFSNFPPVLRDLSVVADSNIKHSELFNTILSVNSGKLLQKVMLFDIFELINEPGKKSYTYSLEFRASDRTLIGEDVNKVMVKIISELYKKHKAELRK